ncbi:YcdB/YcdC domain-containing protein [Gorillibacterium massiliense]|uniref:YcdB/YcdC domain-containing protein n=1 Tax=Gorillibacterium massiliense TaxID=1280390 RepID=UPI0004BA902D|nr:YcdB/YcdC domain-containing protein [Gorillibacterium massiliense]
MNVNKWRSMGIKTALVSLLGLTLLPAAAGAMSPEDMLKIAAGEVTVSGSASAGTVQSGTVETVQSLPPKISEKEAEAIMRKLFPDVLKDATLQQITLGTPHSYPQQPNVWTLDWNITRGNGSYGFGSTLDSQTGDLINFSSGSLYDELKNQYYPPKLTDNQVLDLAKSFVQKASPNVDVTKIIEFPGRSYLRYQSLFSPVLYSVSFDVPLNGLPNSGQSIYLTLDGNGKVMDYSFYKMDNSVSATPKVTKEDAEKKLKSLLHLSAQYVQPGFSQDPNREWILAWIPDNAGNMLVDAKSGDIIDFMGMVQSVSEPREYALEAPKTPFAAVKGTGPKGQLTGDEAAVAVKKVFSIPDDFSLNKNLSTYYLDKSRTVWSLSWTNPDPALFTNAYFSATVDALTGQIISFFNGSQTRFYGSYPGVQSAAQTEKPSTQAISADKAQVIADDLVSRLYPDAATKLKGYVPVVRSADTESFNFTYRNYFNGYPVSGKEVNVMVDSSGKVLNYSADNTPGPGEKEAKLAIKMKKEEAQKVYEDALQTKLHYLSIGGYYTTTKFVDHEVKLVYERSLDNPYDVVTYLDAVSGKWISKSVVPQSDANGVEPKDIAGHWAADSLSAMVKYGVLQPDADGSIKPDETILMGDWMVMMTKALSPDYSYYGQQVTEAENTDGQAVSPSSPYYNAYSAFKQYRWIPSKDTAMPNLEKKLTREDLAESVIGILRYGKLADQLNGKVTPNYQDAAKIAKKADVYLAAQLGIFASGGDFRPQDYVTKAEAAAVLMNMVKLQGKLDQVVGN